MQTSGRRKDMRRLLPRENSPLVDFDGHPDAVRTAGDRRHGEIYAYPQVSEWALDDMFFDVGTWLAEEVAEEVAQEEGSRSSAVTRRTNRPA